jgi:hypothetical protein
MLIRRQFFNPSSFDWDIHTRSVDVTHEELNKFYLASKDAALCLPRATNQDIAFLINGSVISPKGII